MVDTKLEASALVPVGARRGRPRGFDRDEAVATAKALFHARGYDAVGIAQLGEAMRLKAPSLYAAFGNKTGLFERALESYAETDGAALHSALAGPEDPVEGVRALFERAAETYCRDPARPGCMVIETARGPADPAVRGLALTVQAASHADLTRRFAPAGTAAAALADYVVVAMTGLSGAAKSGIGGDALASSARMLADGFALSFEAALRSAKPQDPA